ncbi:hypothetical protein V7S43_012874 [Phytophthora oleae]|uniref:Gfo/Idh/MocA-like oxidoreductase C-terminal domain-containing protein n=1 Tax=Phytophthora oleae TaxID=2107226 RepID=A0ABD3F721_9STRA
MAMNTKEAEEVVTLAKQKRLFFMEGMWARFFPAVRYVRQIIDEGVLGDVHHVHSTFGVSFKADNNRIWKKVTSAGKLNDDGVDVYSFVTLEYSGQRFATLEYSTLAKISETVTITGTKGRIFIQPPAHATMEISVVTYDEQGKETEKTSRFPWPNPSDHHSGFLYEAEAVTEAIRNEQIECSEYSHAELLGIMKIMDTIRHDLKLVYAADAP